MFSIDSFKYVSTIAAHKEGFVNKISSFSNRMKLYFDKFHSENIKYNFHRNSSNLSKSIKSKITILTQLDFVKLGQIVFLKKRKKKLQKTNKQKHAKITKNKIIF